jgi:hypothetical protein
LETEFVIETLHCVSGMQQVNEENLNWNHWSIAANKSTANNIHYSWFFFIYKTKQTNFTDSVIYSIAYTVVL